MTETADELLTVVIPVYNRERLLRETLDSLAAQTVRGFRLVVVDNASTDGSRAVAEAWAAAHMDIPASVLSEERPGAAAARNRGLEAVVTPWTMFFDSDDLLGPDHIGKVLNAIKSYSSADILGWDVSYDGFGRRKCGFARRPTCWTNIMNGNFATQRYAARTGLFRRVGGWNSGVGLWDDIELGARLLETAPKIRKLEGISVFVRSTSESITGSDYSRMIGRMEPALLSIEAHTPKRLRFIADIKRAQYYGLAAREGSAQGREMFRRLRGSAGSLWRKLSLSYIYHTARLGIRGAYLLLKPFYGK